jgi:hypothetical protein
MSPSANGNKMLAAYTMSSLGQILYSLHTENNDLGACGIATKVALLLQALKADIPLTRTLSNFL